MHIAMLSAHVTDPQAAHDFYVNVLGLESAMSMPEMRLFIVRNPSSDTPGLHLEPSDHPGASAYAQGLREAGLPVLVLGTDDLDGEVRRLRERGVRFTGEIEQSPAGRSILFDDTAGNLVQLHEASA